MKVPVSFTYHTGIRGEILPEIDGAILRGSWGVNGNPSPNWASSEINITPGGADGCMQFDGTVQLESGNRFDWGVAFILKDGSEQWAIPTEIKDRASKQRYRSFNLNGSGQHERYYLTRKTRRRAVNVPKCSCRMIPRERKSHETIAPAYEQRSILGNLR